MGSCIANIAQTELIASLQASSQQPQSVPHITLFGIHSSGKTTLLKQLDYLCNNGDNIETITDNINNVVKHIRQSCMNNIIKLALCELIKYQKSIAILNMLSIHKNEDLGSICQIVSDIWSQQNIKKRYAFRYHYTVDGRSFDDNMEYFFDRINVIMSVDFIPSDIDIVKYHTKNAKITNISDDKNRFVVVDPGDFKDFDTINNNENLQQLSEKIKFIIFVASLSDFTVYNMKTKQFAMEQSLDLFKNVVENNTNNIDIVLLFSKMDIFKQCLKKGISLRHCFGMKWTGNEYLNTNTTNLAYANILSKQMGKLMNKIVPNDLIVIIQQYLWIQDLDTKDEEYFDKCCDEAREFIKNQYLKRCKNCKHRVWSQRVDLTDREWTSYKLDIILGVQRIPHNIRR